MKRLKHKKLPVLSIGDETDPSDCHQISIDELERKFLTNSTKGITQNDAETRLMTDGPNQFSKSHSTPMWKLFLESFFTELSIMLWFAMFICFGVYIYEEVAGTKDREYLWLGICLLIVNLVSGFLSFYQVAKGEKTLESFKKLIPKSTTVIRDGERMTIPVEKVVLGDLVELKAGDAIPADIRFVMVCDIYVDNSSITGESKPQERTTEWTSAHSFESKNIGFFSSNITDGTGRGIVIARGDDTEMGKIASLAGRLTSKTPLNYEIKRVSRIICGVAVLLGLIFFIISALNNYPWIKCIIYLMGMIVANVPESLVVTIVVSLTLASKRLAHQSCLVKHLEAVETLGSTTVICSDKTGTLTQNKMTVSHLWYDDRITSMDLPSANTANQYNSPDSEEKSEDEIQILTKKNLATESFDLLMRVVILCNRAVFDKGEMDKPPEMRRVIGDASEAALLKFAEQVIGHVTWYRAKHSKVCEMPFNSTLKFQFSIHEKPVFSSSEDLQLINNKSFLKTIDLEKRMHYLLVLKGAPERIVEICDYLVVRDVLVPITPAVQNVIEDVCLCFGKQGERVLAFADMLLPQDTFPYGYKFATHSKGEFDCNFPLKGLRLLGIISLLDPPRQTVPEAVKLCRSAGVQVIMITGDHPVTAKAIAKRVGIISGESRTIEEWKTSKSTKPPEEVPLTKRKSFSSRLSVCFVEPEHYESIVVTGSEMRELSEEELIALLNDHQEVVFARTSPQQKLRVVNALQYLNHIVAMTGDGVNDSPSLKQADIGIAMGLTGTDVCREVADMVLLNDDFTSIVKGIKEGRLIFDNLKKSIAFTLTTSPPELLPFMVSTIFGIPLPLGITQVLLINVLTCQWPAIALAYEKPERDIMRLRPRSREDRLLNCRTIFVTYFQVGLIQAAAGFCSYFIVMADNGFTSSRLYGIRDEWENIYNNNFVDSFGSEWTYEQRRVLEKTCWTAFFVSLLCTQWADAFICKTRRLSLFQQKNNMLLDIACLVETTLAVIIIYTPYLNDKLNMSPIKWWYWLLPLPWVILIIAYDEARKFIIRRNPTGIVYKCTYY